MPRDSNRHYRRAAPVSWKGHVLSQPRRNEMHHVQPIIYSSIRASIAVPFNLLKTRAAEMEHTIQKDLDRQLMSHAHWYLVNLFRCTGRDFGICSLSWTFVRYDGAQASTEYNAWPAEARVVLVEFR